MFVWFVSARAVLIWAAVLIGAGIYFGFQSNPADLVQANLTNRVSGAVVAIDPGHGGVDPGALGRSGVLEKDISLAIAFHLEELLNRSAIFTVMVRRGDYDLADEEEKDLMVRKKQDIRRRALVAGEAKADVYVSIHANYFRSSSLSGAQTFYYRGKEEGQRLAKHIQEQMVKLTEGNRRVALPGQYGVLRETEMPAALVEVGFLSNPREERLLRTPEYQRRVATAIYLGIINYLSEVRADAASLGI